MYKITEELKTNGFSKGMLNFFIERNNGRRSFNTLDYFCIYIALEDAVFTIKEIAYDIKKGSITYVGPGLDITYCKICALPDTIYLITFSSTFYERSANDSMLLNSELFFDASKNLVSLASSISIEDLQTIIIDRIEKYSKKQNNGLYISVGHNCIETLLLEGLSNSERYSCDIKGNHKFNYVDVVNRFRVLLQKEFMKEKHVSFYAEKLYITPRRLTEMTEAVLGKSAKQLITDKILSEALRMLKYTTHTITETAYNLGFKDEGNFSNFIKKHTRKTPRMIKDAVPNYLEN